VVGPAVFKMVYVRVDTCDADMGLDPACGQSDESLVNGAVLLKFPPLNGGRAVAAPRVGRQSAAAPAARVAAVAVAGSPG
jgi:hypothetical protein